MSTQRYVSTSFWDDPWICSLDPSEKLLYLYLMTNPLTNIAGVYEITIRRICFDTGFNNDIVEKILSRFEEAGKAYYHQKTIVIPSWPRHQKSEHREKIKKGIITVLQNLSQDFLEYLDSIDYQFDLDTVNSTIIARTIRKKVSGTTERKVYEKYNYCCAQCRSTDDLHILHKKSVADGGDNSLDNLMILCSDCHKKVHRGESTYVSNYLDTDLDLDIDTEVKPKPEQRPKPKAYGSHVKLTDQSLKRLTDQWPEQTVFDYIQRLNDYCSSKGKRYKDHEATIRIWLNKDKVPKLNSGPPELQSAQPVINIETFGGSHASASRATVDGEIAS